MQFNKTRTAITLISAAVLPFTLANAQGKPESTGKKWKEGQIIVKPQAGVSAEKFEQILHRSGGHAKASLNKINAHIVEVAAQAEDAVIKALLKSPHIEYAEKDMWVELSSITPNDPKFSLQWHLPKIQAPSAWDSTAGAGITVAILDTGVEATHPDLVNNLVPGWNSVSKTNDTSPVRWHGTSVAGVVAATSNNSTGVASVAWNAKIMPIRITNLSSGNALWSDVASGLVWAADHGADVANISYMVTNSSTVATAAQYMRNKGGVIVVAAGNDNKDPGFSDSPYMITVAATDSSDNKAEFSNYGNLIDVAAPGKGIHTTYTNGGYAKAWGTSFASPATAGVVALIMAANPYLTPDEVEAVLEQSADDLIAGTEWHKYFGHGRVNAAAAVALAMQTAGVDTQAPSVTIFSPSENSKISGSEVVEVDASDDSSIAEVELYVDGELLGTDAMAPYQFSLDTTQMADGNITLVASAKDSAGNVASSSPLSVTIDNVPDVADTQAPTVYISNPADGSTVKRTLRIKVSSNDNLGVKKLTVLVDGSVKCSVTDVSTTSCSWNTRKENSGSHTITAIAEDAAGNRAQSQITVNIGTSSTTGGSTGRGKKK